MSSDISRRLQWLLIVLALALLVWLLAPVSDAVRAGRDVCLHGRSAGRPPGVLAHEPHAGGQHCVHGDDAGAFGGVAAADSAGAASDQQPDQQYSQLHRLGARHRVALAAAAPALGSRCVRSGPAGCHASRAHWLGRQRGGRGPGANLAFGPGLGGVDGQPGADSGGDLLSFARLGRAGGAHRPHAAALGTADGGPPGERFGPGAGCLRTRGSFW